MLKSSLFTLLAVAALSISAASQTQDPLPQQTTRDDIRTRQSPTTRDSLDRQDDGDDMSPTEDSDITTRPESGQPNEERTRVRIQQPNQQRPTEEDDDQNTILRREQVRPRRVEPREADIPFQLFVTGAIGSKLPIFGQELFQQENPAFTAMDKIPVPAEHIVGPGDELLIQVWGQVDGNYRALVDRTGAVYLRTVGTVHVAGLRYGQLENYLRSAMAQYYRNFEINVTLGKLRSIQVLVVGQVKRPGTYTISSLGNVVSALFASGGPKKRGSMRQIQLKRRGRLIANFDLYDLLTGGDESQDGTLLPGDVIYVPPVGQLVALAGSVNVPGIFELKDHTTLGDVIGYAGGLSNTAEGQSAIIEHIVDHHSRKAEKALLTSAGLQTELHDGDIVRFFDISGKFDETVTIRGNVAVPGHYPWRQGMRISDLIPDRDFLVTREHWKHRYQVTSEEQPKTARITETELKNRVKRPSAEINWTYAVIERFDPQKLTTQLLSFNLGRAIQGEQRDNLALEPGDIVTVFSQADAQVPLDEQSKFVHLEGEFNNAGVYQAESGETLRRIVTRAGGLTPKAYLYGAEFTRESTKTTQQARLDEYIRRLEQSVERSAQRPIAPNQEAERERIDSQRRLLDKMKQLKATGRVVLELKPDANTIDALPDLALEDGDRLVVPFQPATVSVIGSVYNENSFVYKTGKTVGSYLQAAGGATKEGDFGRAFVIRADGSTVSAQRFSGVWRQSFSNLKMMRGDTLVVPEKLDRGARMQGFKDWTQIFSQVGLGAAAIAVLLP